MSLLGAIVVAGSAPLTARSLDSLVRQTRAFDSVGIVVGPGLDPRVGDWLQASGAARGWTLLPQSGTTLGARLNTGLAGTPTDWFVVVEAGDALLPTAAAAIETAVASMKAPTDLIAGAARLVALGIDETASADTPDDLAALDPAHPALRSIVWRRGAVDAVGGFDPELAAAVRYDLWLRLIARGGRALALGDTLMRLSVAEAEPLSAELDSLSYRDAVRAVNVRHASLLAGRVGDVLEARARRVTTLGPRHLQVFD